MPAFFDIHSGIDVISTTNSKTGSGADAITSAAAADDAATPWRQLELVRRVETRMAELKLNKLGLARAANLSRQTLYNFLSIGVDGNEKMPRTDTTLALARALDVHPYWLMEGIFLQAQMPAIMQSASEGDRAGFVKDVNFPDGSIIVPGMKFTKIWRVQNLGNEVWEGRKLVCWDEQVTVTSKKTGEVLRVSEGLVPDVQEIPIPRIVPGQVFDVQVNFTAPMTTGTVVSYWLGTHADGTPCFPEDAGVWVRLHVTSLMETVALNLQKKWST
jgi:hypothetical protein